jgi:4'-phosphopantetheinyl transferase
MTLPADEQAKAVSFRFLRDQNDYVSVRGALRDILSRYEHRSRADLEFCYGSHGKPGLDPQSNTQGLHFNVSHSDRLALCAVTRAGEVGIDVERIKPSAEQEMIAERFFSPPEIQALRAFPPVLRLDAFFGYWTRKEAYAKALGEGLWLDWTSFDVSCIHRQEVQNPTSVGPGWSIYPFAPAPGYIAAFAYQGTCPVLKFWKWSSLDTETPPN